MTTQTKLHPVLEEFISSNAYERGHSAGQDEVTAIEEGLRNDLRKVDDLIAGLREYKEMYEGLCH